MILTVRIILILDARAGVTIRYHPLPSVQAFESKDLAGILGVPPGCLYSCAVTAPRESIVDAPTLPGLEAEFKKRRLELTRELHELNDAKKAHKAQMQGWLRLRGAVAHLQALGTAKAMSQGGGGKGEGQGDAAFAQSALTMISGETDGGAAGGGKGGGLGAFAKWKALKASMGTPDMEILAAKRQKVRRN